MTLPPTLDELDRKMQAIFKLHDELIILARRIGILREGEAPGTPDEDWPAKWKVLENVMKEDGYRETTEADDEWHEFWRQRQAVVSPRPCPGCGDTWTLEVEVFAKPGCNPHGITHCRECDWHEEG